MRVGRLVRSLDAWVVHQALDGLAADDVRLEDLLEIRFLHARVPHIVGIDDDHRAVATLREAPGLVDPDVRLETGPQRLGAQEFDVLLHVAPGRAVVTTGAHEDVRTVLAHQAPPPTAAWAAFRSTMNRSTSSRMAWTMSFSGTFRMP